MLLFNSKNIQELTKNWNKMFPIDRWYRKKYNLAFNSPAHRQVCLADMFFEFFEFLDIDIEDKNKEEKEEKYIPGQGNFMKENQYSVKDIDKLFDEIDIDNID